MQQWPPSMERSPTEPEFCGSVISFKKQLRIHFLTCFWVNLLFGCSTTFIVMHFVRFNVLKKKICKALNRPAYLFIEVHEIVLQSEVGQTGRFLHDQSTSFTGIVFRSIK